MKKDVLYTKEQALAHAICALEDGQAVPRKHLMDQMLARNFAMSDVLAVFANGHTYKEPEWNDEHENWVYIVEGHAIDGDELSIVFSINEEGFVYLITGW